jgi:hypothetical protein
VNSTTRKITECLEEAEQLLEDYPKPKWVLTNYIADLGKEAARGATLFEQCVEFCNASEQLGTEPLRLVHHLACTGGTIISKCLAAMPNVVLLSEVNPASDVPSISKLGFAPTNMIQLARQGKVPQFEELRIKLFRAEVDELMKHTRRLGSRLVLRVHSHSDFMVGDSRSQPNSVKKALDKTHAVKSVVTVRHPVDAFVSLSQKNWLHFAPTTFDEYCRRYLAFLEHNAGDPLFKYEDFVYDPKREIKGICDALELVYNEDFLDLIELVKLTGDSGRSSDQVARRPRRPIDDALAAEIRGSANYATICEKLNYDPSISDENLQEAN